MTSVQRVFRPLAHPSAAFGGGTAEVELVVPFHEFAGSDVSYREFRSFLGDLDEVGPKVAWVGRDALIANCGIDPEEAAGFSEDYSFLSRLRKTKEVDSCVVIYVREGIEAPPTVLRNFLWRLFTTSGNCFIQVQSFRPDEVLSISGPDLAGTLARSSELKRLRLYCFVLDEEHCRALADVVDRPDITLSLRDCTLTDSVLLRESKIQICISVDLSSSSLLTTATTNDPNLLRGISSITDYGVRNSNSPEEEDEDERNVRNNEVVQAVAHALRENEGLEYLEVHGFVISPENWTLLLRSLHNHRTLTEVELWKLMPADLSSEDQATRLQAVVDLLRVNHNIHTVTFDESVRTHPVYQNSILPLLEANHFRPRITAMWPAPLSLRPAVLGRALDTVSNDPRLLWQFLSSNLDIVAAYGSAARMLVTRSRSVEEAIDTSTDNAEGVPVLDVTDGGSAKAAGRLGRWRKVMTALRMSIRSRLRRR